jgi:hypothetical protein
MNNILTTLDMFNDLVDAYLNNDMYLLETFTTQEVNFIQNNIKRLDNKNGLKFNSNQKKLIKYLYKKLNKQ